MKNLSIDELKIIKHSLEVQLKDCETFKRGNYGRLTEEEEKKIKRVIQDKAEEAIELCELFYRFNKNKIPTNNEVRAFIYGFVINEDIKLKDAILRYKKNR